MSPERRGKTPGTFLGRRIVNHKNRLPGWIRKFGATGLFLRCRQRPWLDSNAPRRQRHRTTQMTDAVRQLQDEVRELRNAVVELRSEAGQYRAETEQLRKELEARGPAPEAAAANSGSAHFRCGAVGRACRLSGGIFRAADQQGGRPIPDQGGGGVKVSRPAVRHCAAESVQ